MTSFEKVNWEDWRLFIYEHGRIYIEWFFLRNNLRESVMWLLWLLVFRTLLLFTFSFLFALSCFLWLPWFICVVSGRNIDYLFDDQAVILELLVISFIVKGKALKNVVQLLGIDFSTHSWTLGPLWEKFFKTRAGFLTEI